MNTEETLQARKSQFITIFAGIHGIDIQDPAGYLMCENMFESELFNFQQMFKIDQKREATTLDSRAAVFLEVVSNGLTFSPAMNQVYLTQRNFTTEVEEMRGNEKVVMKVVEARLQWQKTVDGKLFLCIKAGSVVSIKPPVIVYEGDRYEYMDNNGEDQLLYVERAEKTDKDKIIGGYVWVREPGDIRTLYRMDMQDIERLSGYSARNGGGTANALYKGGPDGQIDRGFFKTKIKSHALNNYMDKATALSNYSAILEDNEYSRSFSEPEATEEAPTFQTVTEPAAAIPDPTILPDPAPAAVQSGAFIM